ncbi:unnamed protein product, partial [Polarella glacialis]
METPRATSSATWSVSFKDASKFQASARSASDDKVARWTAGNNDSASFFRKMGSSMADTERARAQCRSAAASSPSRDSEEKVNLYNMLSTIEAAKGISKFAAQCIREDGDGNATDEGTMFAPAALSHLAVPGVTEKVAATKMQAILRGRKARQQVNAMNDANSEVRPGDSPEQMLEDQEVADQAATLLPNDRKSESIDAPPLPTDLRRPSTKMSAFGESVDDDFGEEAPSKDQRKSSKGTSKESE